MVRLSTRTTGGARCTKTSPVTGPVVVVTSRVTSVVVVTGGGGDSTTHPVNAKGKSKNPQTNFFINFPPVIQSVQARLPVLF